MALTITALSVPSFSQVPEIRYNRGGYFPEAPKKVWVCGLKDDFRGLAWRVEDVEGKVVMDGALGRSKSGASQHTPFKAHHELDLSKLETEGRYQLYVGNMMPVTIRIDKEPYREVIGEVIGYLRQQRCGSHDARDHGFCHGGDGRCPLSTWNNGNWEATTRYEGVAGGWHDAGDYIKFTLTISYTAYFLLRAYQTNPALFKDLGTAESGLPTILDEAQWGLDFLMRCMPDQNTFIIQVADETDHREGERMPEDDKLDGLRKAYAAFSPTQMGSTAAALALGADVFEELGQDSLAMRYRQMAIQIYETAREKATSIAWYGAGWEVFYKDEKGADNMELAAIELYKLTGEKRYLNEAKTYAAEAGKGYWYSWAVFNMISHLRVMEENSAPTTPFMEDLYDFQAIANDPGNVWGFPHKYTWATLYSAFGVANSAMLYSLQQKDKFSSMGYDVLDYTMGRNPWGKAMISSPQIPGSVYRIYSQVYRIKDYLNPAGGIAEGPGDRPTHDNLDKYFNIPVTHADHLFNTDAVVFFDHAHDFQCMETTIVGLADGIMLLTLMETYHEQKRQK